MAAFSVAYQLVARAEGGYQNHPNDSGNYNSLGQLVGTNWGISAPVYESWIQRPPTKSDMQAVTQSLAETIYRAKFWDAIKGDAILNQELANIFMDGIVNHGKTGVKLMQQVLKVTADGIVGPITLGALNRAEPARVYLAYKEARRKFYHQLAQQKPALSVFLKGWLARIEKFKAFTAAASGISAAGAALGFIILLLMGSSKKK